MTVSVFGTPTSPYLRSALLVLEEKGVAYDFHAIGHEETKRPQWRMRHPFGRLPAFEHDGQRLFETAPFLRYVDAAFDGPALQPVDAKAAMRMNQQMAIVDAYVMPLVGRPIGFQRVIAPMRGLVPDEAVIAAALPDAENCLRAIVGLMPRGADFLVGDRLTLADLMMVPHIEFLSLTPEGRRLLGDGPLARWLARMQQRASLVKTDPKRLPTV